MVDVSIILVNYKTKDLTINAIKSVIEHTDGLNYEIFIVDNASGDDSIKCIQTKFSAVDITQTNLDDESKTIAPQIYVIKNKINSGFGGANNLAIKNATGKYVFCLNTDTLLIENSIKKMYEYMETNTNVAVCGCQLINPDYTFQNSFGYYHTYYDFLVRQFFLKKKYAKIKKINNEKSVDYIVGADLFLRKSVLDEIGLFDENIFMYEDEVDLCYRIRQKYDIKFLPDTKIIHLGGQSSNSDFARQLTIKGIFYFVKKHKTVSKSFLKLYYIVKFGAYSFFTKDKFYINIVKSILSKELS